MPRARISYGLLSSRDQGGGGGKKQGLPVRVGLNFSIIRRKAWPSLINYTEPTIDESLTPQTLPDAIFIIKYNSDGLILWKILIEESINNVGREITSDSENIYVCGTYNSSSEIILKNAEPPSQPQSTHIPLPNTQSLNSGYIIKYNSFGVSQWAVTLRTNTNDTQFNKVINDFIGGIYVSGSYNSSSPITLKNGDGTLSNIIIPITDSNGTNGVYSYNPIIIKYNPDGIVQWACTIPISGSFFGITSNDNDIYVSGYCSGLENTITLNNANGTPSAITIPPIDFTACLIVKYNLDGVVQWAATIKGNPYSRNIGMFDIYTTANNFYVTGYYNSELPITLLNADGTTSNKILPATLGPDNSFLDIFIIKYNSNGIVQWAATIGEQPDFIGNGISLIIYNAQLYVCGQYYSKTNIINLKNANGNYSNKTLPITNVNNSFIIRYNTSGSVVWAVSIKSDYQNITYKISSDELGGIYICGYYSKLNDDIILKNADGTNSNIILPKMSTLVSRSFIIKYDVNGIVKWANTYTYTGNRSISAFSINTFNPADGIYVTGGFSRARN